MMRCADLIRPGEVVATHLPCVWADAAADEFQRVLTWR